MSSRKFRSLSNIDGCVNRNFTLAIFTKLIFLNHKVFNLKLYWTQQPTVKTWKNMIWKEIFTYTKRWNICLWQYWKKKSLEFINITNWIIHVTLIDVLVSFASKSFTEKFYEIFIEKYQWKRVLNIWFRCLTFKWASMLNAIIFNKILNFVISKTIR